MRVKINAPIVRTKISFFFIFFLLLIVFVLLYRSCLVSFDAQLYHITKESKAIRIDTLLLSISLYPNMIRLDRTFLGFKSGSSSYALVFVAVLVAAVVSTTRITVVEGRQWQTIIDTTIVRNSDIDHSRYELKIEADPFFDAQAAAQEQNTPSSTIPTEGTTTSSQQQGWTTLSPTVSPSTQPTDGPSMGPTPWSIEQNGGCRQGLTLYQVHMYDTWGDGWDDVSLTIEGLRDQDPTAADLPANSMTSTSINTQGDTVVSISKTIALDAVDSTVLHPNPNQQIDPLGIIFDGKLQRGSHDYADVCLVSNRCYHVTVTDKGDGGGGNTNEGGELFDEISWDLRPVNTDPESLPFSILSPSLLEPTLLGGAPSVCTFSLPDEYGHHFCPNTCSSTIGDTAAPPVSDVLGTMHVNEDGAASETLIEATVGRNSPQLIPSGSLEGKTTQTAIITESMLQTARSGNTKAGSSFVLNKFHSAESNEHS